MVTLAPETRLGPYEIVAPLGSGGMGEVYRARDPRIGREVALKVLPAHFAGDPAMQRRLEQETRAIGALQHPNVLAVYDTGLYEGAPYFVCELLEGQTLRQRLAEGPLSVRKVVDYGVQAARGLGAAHDKGVVHRDLKPENLFVTSGGIVKILDFGLAKVAGPSPGEGRTAPVLTPPVAATEPGVVLGTMGYMAPEQVRGLPADARSDIFALGLILHEMLGGRRTFGGDSAVEVMHAILKDDPPALSSLRADVSPPLERLVLRCLEKDPQQRFHSAEDLAFALEALADGGTRGLVAGSLPALASRWRRRWRPLLAGAALVAAGGAGPALAARLQAPPPEFHRLTFRRGAVRAARFAPDGQTVLYGAQWDTEPIRVYTVRAGTPESQPLAIPEADLLAVSRTGELAVALGRPAVSTSSAPLLAATLARVALAGGAPREVREHVSAADWTPDGSALAIAVRVPGQPERIEFPPGTVVHEARGRAVGMVRLSPDGRRLAFVDQVPGDSGGAVAVLQDGRVTQVSGEFDRLQGLAWKGDEVWFSAAPRADQALALFATTLNGSTRLVLRAPTSLVLHDISPAGRVLLATDDSRVGLVAQAPGETAPRDLSWLDGSLLSDLSRDGRSVLFTEFMDGGGHRQAVYLRSTSGGPAVRLGPGRARALSADGKWVLAVPESSAAWLELMPTGAGEGRRLQGAGVRYWSARFLPDGQRLVAKGNEPDRPPRLFVQGLDGSAPRAVTPEGARAWSVSLDGKEVAVGEADGTRVYPVEGGEGRPLAGLLPDEAVFPGGWFDRDTVVFQKSGEVWRLDRKSGKKERWIDPRPLDRAGVWAYAWTAVSADGRAFATSYYRTLSDLFLAEGLR